MKSTKELLIQIYTDGSSRGNPGPGGYGAVLLYGPHKLELSQGFRLTTNNRMELLAVIEAIKKIKILNMQVQVFTDSKYVVDSVEKGWLKNWLKIGFKNKKNADLWREYVRVSQNHHIKFHWIKGHNGHPLNERCDQLATQAADSKDLKVDSNFEKMLQSQKDDSTPLF
jgi:ribonuclease HI